MSGLAFFFTVALCGSAAQAPEPGPARAPGALTLREAVAEALGASPALQPARDAVEIAAIQEQLQQSAFGLQVAPLLQFGAFGHGMRQHQFGLAVSRRLPTGTELSVSADWLQLGFAGATQGDAGLTVTAAQSVLQAFGPAWREGLTAARRASQSAARRAGEARQDLVLRTAGAYFAVVRQQLLVEASAQARLRAERLQAASSARARVGLATGLDVMRAELLAAQAEASHASQQEALERARDDLHVLLGRPVGSPLAVDLADVPDAAGPPPPDLADLQAAALARRTDLRDARSRVEDAVRGAEVAKWSALPDVQVTASYTRRGIGNDGPSVFDDWLGGWRAGIRTTYGLQRAAAGAAAAAAAIGVRAAERDVVAREQHAAAAVRAAHRAVVRTAGAIEIQQKAAAVAERQARLAALRSERGLADNVDLIDAEMNLLQARAALIGARVDHALARLTLERESGLLDSDRYLK
jgi:outer membrane protein TolC